MKAPATNPARGRPGGQPVNGRGGDVERNEILWLDEDDEEPDEDELDEDADDFDDDFEDADDDEDDDD